MATAADCILKARERFSEFTEQELREMASEVHELRGKLRESPVRQGDVDAFFKMKEIEAQKEALKAMASKIDRKLNVPRLEASIKKRIEGGLKSHDAVEAFLVGTRKGSVFGGEQSIYNLMDTNREGAVNKMELQLNAVSKELSKQSGASVDLGAQLRSAAIDKEIHKEFIIGKGASKNPYATAIADVYNHHNMENVVKQNKNNIYVEFNRQRGASHISDKGLLREDPSVLIKEAEAQANWDKMMKFAGLDPATMTAEEIANYKSGFLTGYIKSQVSGHDLYVEGQTPSRYQYGERGTRIEQHKMLIWNETPEGAESAWKVRQKYSPDTTLAADIYGRIRSDARESALIDHMGRDVEGNLMSAVQKIHDAEVDPDIRKNLRDFLDGKPTNRLYQAAAEVFGRHDDGEFMSLGKIFKNSEIANSFLSKVPESVSSFVKKLDAQKIYGFVRVQQAWAKLRGVVFDLGLTDTVPVMMTAMHRGENPLRVANDIIKSMVMRYDKDPVLRAELFERLNTNATYGIGGLWHDTFSKDAAAGFLGKAADARMRWSGEKWGIARQHDAVNLNNARWLADTLALGENMKPEARNALRQYGFTEKELSALSKVDSKVLDTASGKKAVFTPEMARLIGGFTEKEKMAIEEKLQGFFSGELKNILQNMTAQQGMFMHRPISGLTIDPNTPAGIAFSAFMMFKSWPVWYMQGPFKRMLQGSAKGGFEARTMGVMLPAAFFYGYLRVASAAALTGKTPPPLWSEEGIKGEHILTGLESMGRGGGGGYYADVVLARYNSHNRGALELFGGPLYGEAWKIAQKTLGPARGGSFWTAHDAYSTAINNAPFINLHAFRMGFNMLLGNQISGYLDPEFGTKMENYAKEHGQSYFLPVK